MNILNGLYFRNKCSITDVRLVYIRQASENIEIFNMMEQFIAIVKKFTDVRLVYIRPPKILKFSIRWSKLSRLLQRVAFLVIFSTKTKF